MPGAQSGKSKQAQQRKGGLKQSSPVFTRPSDLTSNQTSLDDASVIKSTEVEVAAQEKRLEGKAEDVKEPAESKPAAPTKRFKPDRIEKMAFRIKTEEDPVDERGIIQYESCHVCKWFIEKGNYYL